MRRISFKLFSVLALSAMTMFSCGENGDGNDDVTPNSSSSVGRVYILNEGVFVYHLQSVRSIHYYIHFATINLNIISYIA